MYGHAERVRIAAQQAIAETIELLLALPSLDEDQQQFIREFAPERPRVRTRGRSALRLSPRDQSG